MVWEALPALFLLLMRAVERWAVERPLDPACRCREGCAACVNALLGPAAV